ncbi:MAG: aspartate/glutamate racemase family protein [Xanthobacteraceae bacterium]|nr:aspartate/glutamate racemase family protein [Xanthobacteraceae bacterium]
MKRLGMLTPSSNTVLEPATVAMIASLQQVSVHFSRFKVTEIALSAQALGQFDHDEILRAAELLAHAKVDVIAWNGTSASWLGFDRDEALCERIEAATGIRACTSVLAFREIFERTGQRRIGIVTPYTEDVQQRICDVWAREGITCAAERHLDLRDNYSFAEVSEERISTLVKEVAAEGCDAVAIVCTNMRGSRIAASLESSLGIPIYDSIAATVWKSLEVVGENNESLAAWGRLFSDPALGAVRDREPIAVSTV